MEEEVVGQEELVSRLVESRCPPAVPPRRSVLTDVVLDRQQAAAAEANVRGRRGAKRPAAAATSRVRGRACGAAVAAPFAQRRRRGEPGPSSSAATASRSSAPAGRRTGSPRRSRRPRSAATGDGARLPCSSWCEQWPAALRGLRDKWSRMMGPLQISHAVNL